MGLGYWRASWYRIHRPILRNVQLIIPHYEVVTLEFPGGPRKIAVFASKSENCTIPPKKTALTKIPR